MGLLVNNVGMVHYEPQLLMQNSDVDIADMINCNIYSTVMMTRAVLPFMKAKASGCVVTVSSGSSYIPAPYIVVYSSPKAFISQFSRSLHVEHWGTGVDFLVVNPLYVVSNLYKRKAGTLSAPLPISLVKGALAQLGKQYVWEGPGYWFHGIQSFLTLYLQPITTENSLIRMKGNRDRWEARQKDAAIKK